MKQISAVVMDLDNTLWDWVAMWFATFTSQLKQLVELSGIPEDDLKAEIRAVHQRHGTSEYAFLIEELPSLSKFGDREAVLQRFAPAIDAFRRTRRDVLQLYPGVRSTLARLRDAGCVLVAYTESQAFYTAYRIRKLNLDGTLQFLYSPPDHDLPKGLTRDQVRTLAASEYELKGTIHRHTPKGELKPNAGILLSILTDVGIDPAAAVYVGDSLMKDVAMAQDAGIIDVYAAYGSSQDSAAYQLLRDVTHWSNEDVEREKRIHERGTVAPSHVLKKGFAELLELFNFVAHGGGNRGRQATGS